MAKHINEKSIKKNSDELNVELYKEDDIDYLSTNKCNDDKINKKAKKNNTNIDKVTNKNKIKINTDKNDANIDKVTNKNKIKINTDKNNTNIDKVKNKNKIKINKDKNRIKNREGVSNKRSIKEESDKDKNDTDESAAADIKIKKIKLLEETDKEDNDIILHVNEKMKKKLKNKEESNILSKKHEILFNKLLRKAKKEERQERENMRKELNKDIGFDTKLNSDNDDSELSETSYSSEDEIGKLDTKKKNNKVKEILQKLWEKDPSIYDPSIKFFSSSDDSDNDENNNMKNIKKYKKNDKEKITLGKLLSTQINEEMKDEEDIYDKPLKESIEIKTFLEMQEEQKQEFIKTADNDEALKSIEKGDDLFDKSKPIWHPTIDNDNNKEPNEIKKYNDKEYLKEYIYNEWWKNTNDNENVPSATILFGDERAKEINENTYDEIDSGEEEKMENFEYEYNTRLLDDNERNIQNYPRINMLDTVRKLDKHRSEARLNVKNRKQAEKKQQLEDLQRQKNVHRKAILDRVKAISIVAGINDNNTTNKKILSTTLDDDFNPEEHDKFMSKIFDDNFYGELKDDTSINKEKDNIDINTIKDTIEKTLKESIDEHSNSIKDNTNNDNKEKDEYINKEIEKIYKDTENFILRNLDLSIKPNIEKDTKKLLNTNYKELLNNDNTTLVTKLRELPSEKRQSLLQDIVKNNLEKLDTLNKEDIKLGTRYNYVNVPSNDFGINIVDILNSTDKELNKKVSIKYLAPYREESQTSTIDWKDIQKKQKKDYREYMSKQYTMANKQTPRSSKFYYKNNQDVVMYKKKRSQIHDLSQGTLSVRRKDGVYSNTWYNRLNKSS